MTKVLLNVLFANDEVLTLVFPDYCKTFVEVEKYCREVYGILIEVLDFHKHVGYPIVF